MSRAGRLCCLSGCIGKWRFRQMAVNPDVLALACPQGRRPRPAREQGDALRRSLFNPRRAAPGAACNARELVLDGGFF